MRPAGAGGLASGVLDQLAAFLLEHHFSSGLVDSLSGTGIGRTCASWGGSRSFSRDGADEGAENRGATIEVFVNKENDEKMPKGLPGAGGSTAVPFPKPLLPLGDRRHSYKKVEMVCPKIMPSEGFTHASKLCYWNFSCPTLADYFVVNRFSLWC